LPLLQRQELYAPLISPREQICTKEASVEVIY